MILQILQGVGISAKIKDLKTFCGANKPWTPALHCWCPGSKGRTTHARWADKEIEGFMHMDGSSSVNYVSRVGDGTQHDRSFSVTGWLGCSRRVAGPDV